MKKCHKSVLRSVAHYIYLNSPLRFLRRISQPEVKDKGKSSVRIAYICDQMTWSDFSDFSVSLFIHPDIWKKQLESFNPDILFCESAWFGIDQYGGFWRGRIYRDQRLCFDNRSELNSILEYCKEHNIKTIFWNKEDPTYFQHPVYDFTETAIKFDYILTTALECVEKYKALGHHNVSVMPFGVNMDMFYPEGRDFIPGTAVFAGSWFADQPGRCADLERLLDYALKQGWKLDIYDRKSERRNKNNRFPEKYRKFVKNAVPFEDIPKICKRYEYAINVNTVTESETMCSRRLMQMISCGITVISNGTMTQKRLSDMMDFTDLGGGICQITPGINPDRFSTENMLKDCVFRVLKDK